MVTQLNTIITIILENNTGSHHLDLYFEIMKGFSIGNINRIFKVSSALTSFFPPFHQVLTWWFVMKGTFWKMKCLRCPKPWILSGRGGELSWLEHLCKTILLNVRISTLTDRVVHFQCVYSYCRFYQITAWSTSSRRTCWGHWKSSGTASLTLSRTASVPTLQHKMCVSWRRGHTFFTRCWLAAYR